MTSSTGSTDIAILIPAAGASTRMRGRDKLLEPVAGEALLARQTRIASATGNPVLVTLPPQNPVRHSALSQFATPTVTIREIARAHEGLAASVREGAAWAASLGVRGLMILLADLPELETKDLTALINAFADDPGRVWRATDQAGTPGHPVIMPRRLFPALTELRGDTGARGILAGEPIADLALPDAHATTDLDTPEDWAKWRAKSGM